MNKKEINDICNYIKENPKCIIDYCDCSNFVIYKTNAHYVSRNRELGMCAVGFDYDVIDEGESYIPNIALILQACAKKGIDITQLKIKSC